MGDDVDRFVIASRRRGALRILALGGALIAFGVIYYVWRQTTPGAKAAFSALVVGLIGWLLGGALTIAGAVMLARARRANDPDRPL